MDVFSADGKKLGYIKDVIVDMNEKTIKGFDISSNTISNRKSIVLCEDVVTFSTNMVVNGLSFGNYLSFFDVKNVDVIDINGNVIGIISDLVFDMNNFRINAIIISTGVLKDIFIGKKVLLPKSTVLGENSLLFLCNKKSIEFKSNIHKLDLKDDEKNEK